MLTLLPGLHAIAAQRGDGLRPELLETRTSRPISTNIEGTAMHAPSVRTPVPGAFACPTSAGLSSSASALDMRCGTYRTAPD